MAKSFTNIGSLKPHKSWFNLSNDYKYTCKFGSLIPVCVRECVPGDVVKYGVEAIVRLNPTLAPILHKMDIRFEAFFVPNRLVFDKWESYITGGESGNINVQLPLLNDYFLNPNANPQKKLWDFFGLPIPVYTEEDQEAGTIPDGKVIGDYKPFDSSVYTQLDIDKKREITPIALPFYAYSLIWNEYYRDQNIQSKVDINDNRDILSRCWTKNDYFTSALPFILRGIEPKIDLSLGGVGVDITNTVNNGFATFADDGSVLIEDSSDSSPSIPSMYHTRGDFSDSGFSGDSRLGMTTSVGQSPVDNDMYNRKLSVLKDVVVEGQQGSYDKTYNWQSLKSNVSVQSSGEIQDGSLSIGANQLRWLMQVQKFLERNARAGSRYCEQLMAHFGVKGGDYRLQRPEFLGSTKSPIIVSEVPQTSAGESGSPQANLAGKGLGAVSSDFVNYRCYEHGYFMVFASIVPKLSYNSQGIHKSWYKPSRYSYYFPEFAHLTEQPIHNSELFFPQDFQFKNDDDSETFGYTGIYNEYRDFPDMVSSGMRDQFDYWHLNRKFSSMPALNSDFISIENENNELSRVMAVQNEDFFIVDVANKVSMLRPMPILAEPGLIDHF